MTRFFRPLSFDVYHRPTVGPIRIVKRRLRMGAAMSLAEEVMRTTGGKAWMEPV